MGKGKKVGKIAFAVAGFALGYSNPAMFGIDATVKGAAFAGGMYGMSIASTLWSVTQKPNAFGNLDGTTARTTTVSSAQLPTIFRRTPLSL